GGAGGGPGGAPARGFMSPPATVNGPTQAYIGGTTTVPAGGLDVQATATSTATATSVIVGVGVFTGAGAQATSTVNRTTQAYVAPGAGISAPGASVTLGATSNPT